MSIYNKNQNTPINKYHQWYINIIDRGLDRLDYVDGEVHHIIPKSLGERIAKII
jgi:hypothetical protein